MKSVRILLSENCNADCKNCFNNSYRTEKSMTFNDFCNLADYLAENGVTKIKIMGGEPTVHLLFKDVFEYAQTRFKRVIVFTNALNNKILKISPREKDSIVYNANFINSKMDINKLLLEKEGTRIFEIQVSSDLDVNKFIKEINTVLKKIETRYTYNYLKDVLGINLTLNCMEDIFSNKKKIIENWNKLYKYLYEIKKYDVKVDHSIPWCFFVNTDMEVHQGIWKCSSQCSGLIDSEFNLRYCNQYPLKLINIKDKDNFIPMKKIDNYLYMGHIEKIDNNLRKICKDCPFFNTKCNGGCFIHKEFITSENVISKTDLPIRKIQ